MLSGCCGEWRRDIVIPVEPGRTPGLTDEGDQVPSPKIVPHTKGNVGTSVASAGDECDRAIGFIPTKAGVGNRKQLSDLLSSGREHVLRRRTSSHQGGDAAQCRLL